MSPAPARQTSWPELLAHPDVRERWELRSRFGFLAIHAGVEGGTFEVARHAADAVGASWYAVTQPPRLRWHVPSAEVVPEQSESLAAFLDHVETVIAVHGYGRLSRPRDILVGGANRDLAVHVVRCLRRAAPEFEPVVDMDDIPVQLRGLHPSNPVNRTSGGGVQLELPPAARGASWQPSEAGRPCVPPLSVTSALAEAAATWSQ